MPGSGDLPPRNAADIAWSEYNHHWSGLFVLAIGVLSLLNAAGCAGRSIGRCCSWASRCSCSCAPIPRSGRSATRVLCQPPRHRGAAAPGVRLLIAAFADLRMARANQPHRESPGRSLLFPLLCAGGGVLLLTHSHAIANVKEQLLIELTHTPLALAGIVAGWARWLELRLDPATEPRRLAHRALALAGVLHSGGFDAVELSRGVVVTCLTPSPGRPILSRYRGVPRRRG